MRIPVFPLSVALVPGLVLPLHIFEPRYRLLVERLLAEPESTGREFGIIAVRDGRSVEAEGQDALYEVGVGAALREVEALADGRYNIITTGTRRFRLLSLDTSEPLLHAEVQFLDEVSSSEDTILAAAVRRGFDKYRMLLTARLMMSPEEPLEQSPTDPDALAYVVTATMVLPTSERQELLAAETTSQRLSLARLILTRECALITELSSVPTTDLGSISPSLN